MLNTTDYNNLAFWPWVSISPDERKPLSWDDSKKTVDGYDLPNMRYYMGRNYGNYYDFMRACSVVNEAFVTGRLWGLRADFNSFLMDEGVTNTRQPFIFPLSQTMNTRLIGKLSRISINGKVEPIGQYATTKKEEAMARAVVMSMAAQAGPEVAKVMQEQGVSADPIKAREETEMSFVDPLQKATNMLLSGIAARNKYDEMRKHVGQNVNVSGMGCTHAFTNGSHYDWEVVDSRYVFYDVAAKRPDASDGAFCGFFKFWSSISAIAEAFNLDKAKVERLEAMVRAYAPTSTDGTTAKWPAGCPVTATGYYRDGRYIKRGFIEGPDGPELVSVDTINPDTEKPYYTEADLIDPPQTEFTRNWKGKTMTRFYEYVRWIVFIPHELMPNKQGAKPEEKIGDFVVTGGEYPLQECDPDHEAGVSFPLKMATWMNVGGFVVAPLTAVMSPQRIINQLTSDIVWRMSKSRSQTVFFDKKALASANMTIKQALIAYKRGDPLYGDTVHIGGAQNAVQNIGGGLDPNIFKEWELLQGFIRVAEDATGLYAQNSGAPGSANQLVGVKEMQERQEDTMTRQYFACIQSLFEQMYQFDAQAGRRFYIKHPWTLVDMVGSEGAKVLTQTKYSDLLQFRMKAALTMNPEELKQTANMMILQEGGLLDRKLITPISAGKLLGKSYPEEVWPYVERDTQEMAMAQEAMAKEQAKAAQIGMLQEREQQLMDQEREMYGKAFDMTTKADQTNMKGDMPMLSAQAKQLEPQQAAAA